MKAGKSDKRIFFMGMVLFSLLLLSQDLAAQDTLAMAKETQYYRTYFQNLIGRVYTARKYVNFDMKSTDGTHDFKYKANTSNGIGLGVTYRALTINIGYGFGFLFNDKNKGKTKALDLQTRLYASKWAIDCYIKSYRGYYLSAQDVVSGDGTKLGNYYIRPDVKLRMFGASAYRMFNGKGFSLRPAFVQDVRQKKSGGSFLAGGEWYYMNFKSDSSIVPNKFVTSGYKSFSLVNMLQIGPGIGYAYTKVFPRNFFATGYVTGNMNVSLLHESKESGLSLRTGFNTNLLYRFALGYDNGRYSICAYIINNRIDFKGTAYNYNVNSGNMRLMFAKRFSTTRAIKKYMNYFNILID